VRTSLCLFTDSVEPSGMGEHMLTLAAELRHRYRISFVCPPGVAGDSIAARAAALGVETYRLSVQSPGDDARRLSRWLRTRQVEIFHGHAGIGWEGHAGLEAARAAEVSVVLRTEHLPYLLIDERQRREHARAMALVDCLICVSKEAYSSFVRANVSTAKLRVIQNGIQVRPAPPDLAGVKARLKLNAGAKMILTVARYSDQKGHRDLLAAIPFVRQRVPEAVCVWVGRGPLEAELRARANTLDVSEHLVLLGQRDDVPDLMAAADLFVLPSHFEGLPIVVLEAMAASCPILATRVCGNVDAVVDGVTGRLVPPREPVALAEAMLELLLQPELARQLGRAGRDRLQRRFSADRMCREVGALYEELLGGATGTTHRCSQSERATRRHSRDADECVCAERSKNSMTSSPTWKSGRGLLSC
jgi:glycosyltransferase involved in cell wall biosynthesis